MKPLIKVFSFLFFVQALFSDITPFYESLGPLKKVNKTYRCVYLPLLEKAYNHNHYKNVTPSVEPRIPKCIHMIWLGSKLPEKFYPFVESWKRHHPDWEFKLWTDDDIESFPFITGDAIHKAQNYGQKSDIFRYEILNRYGGLYIDTDFYCLKPHDILHHTCDFYTGMGARIIYNGNMGAAPGHPIIQNCLNKIKSSKINDGHYAMSIIHKTGPVMFMKSIIKHLKITIEGSIVFPTTYFYSFPLKQCKLYWNRKNPAIFDRYATEDSFASHAWAHSWVRKPQKKPPTLGND